MRFWTSFLYTLIQAPEKFNGLALCLCSLELLKSIKFLQWLLDTPDLCCFKNLMNLLCCQIFQRCNCFLFRKVWAAASLSSMLQWWTWGGLKSFFYRNRNIILLGFCFRLYEQFFVSFVKVTQGNNKWHKF